MVGTLMNLFRSQENVYPNIKGLLQGLLLLYAPSSWWLEFLFWVIFMTYDEYVGCWTPLIPTQKSYPTSTIPSTLPLFHIFGHFFMMKVKGCIIQAISEAFPPWTVQRHKVRGTGFYWFSSFLEFCRVWSSRRRIIITLLFLWVKPYRTFPRCLS